MKLSYLDSFKLLLLLTVYLLIVHQAESQDSDEELEISSRSNSCRSASNKPGACIRLRSCRPLMRLLWYRPFVARRVIRSSICGTTSSGRRLVCCPGVESDDDNNSSTTSTTSRTTSSTTSRTTSSTTSRTTSSTTSRTTSSTTSSSTSKVEPLKPPQCGYSDKPHNRVVGGSPAEIGAWPWIANVGVESDENSNEIGFGCGGSLISSRHVVTAGHCVYQITNRMYVRLGEYDLSSDEDGADPIDIPVEKIILHPDYDHEYLENDIAILKLAEEVEFTDAIQPICLPVENDIKNRNFVNYYPFVAGWGKTSKGGSSSAVLRETQVPVVAEKTCKKNYREIKNAVVDYRVICAGYTEGGKDACQGDSGGPLMFPQKETYYLIGVVSGGRGCAEPGFPGLYTRVTAFLDFILSNMD